MERPSQSPPPGQVFQRPESVSSSPVAGGPSDSQVGSKKMHVVCNSDLVSPAAAPEARKLRLSKTLGGFISILAKICRGKAQI